MSRLLSSQIATPEPVKEFKDFQGRQSTKHFSTSHATGMADSLPGILLELVSIVSQISNADKMLDAVRGSAPSEGSDAAKWHQVSMQALAFSRQAMGEKQDAILARLAAVTGTDWKPPGLSPHTSVGKSGLPIAWRFDSKGDELDKPTGVPNLDQPDGDPEKSTTSSHCESFEKGSIPAHGEGSCDPALGSLKLDLEKLKQCPAGSVLLVRKIKQLGFDSQTYIQEHFSQFGHVKEILVAHSVTKPTAKRARGRVRPAGLGFMIMATVEDAQKVLSSGKQHLIAGNSNYDETHVSVEVEVFQPNLEDDIRDAW